MWREEEEGRMVSIHSPWLLNIDALSSLLLGDGRWRQVIRRCASVAETGVTGVCNWGVYENGVYWEECYCTSDSCNAASTPYHRQISIVLYGLLILGILMRCCRMKAWADICQCQSILSIWIPSNCCAILAILFNWLFFFNILDVFLFLPNIK